jgi:hypothetical protein
MFPPFASRIFWLLTLLLLTPLHAGTEPSPTVRIVVLGEVSKPAVYTLPGPATAQVALTAAGGWSGRGIGPARYCYLEFNHKEGKKDRIKISLKIDPKRKTIEVTDPVWKTKALPAGAVLTVPEMIF